MGQKLVRSSSSPGLTWEFGSKEYFFHHILKNLTGGFTLKLVWTRLDSSGLVWTRLDSSGLVYDFLVSILTLGNTLCLKWTRLRTEISVLLISNLYITNFNLLSISIPDSCNLLRSARHSQAAVCTPYTTAYSAGLSKQLII